MSTTAILTAAGSGSRLGHALPKALVPLAGVPLVVHAARRLAGSGAVDAIVVTVPAALAAEFQAVLDRAELGVPVTLAVGGATRQASVAAALAHLASDVDVVLVHDAARALAPSSLVARVAAAVRSGHRAVVPGEIVTDTIVQVDDRDQVVANPDRTVLRTVQTPQGFDRTLLVRAHDAGAHLAGDESVAATDDASLVAALGEPVAVVAGHPDAVKITTPRDLAAAGLMLASARPTGDVMTELPRTGVGIDVHAFDAPGNGRVLALAGLTWPGERALAGHSDADVAAHAAADALLTAAGLGDLGSNFGTAEPQWEGAAGVALLSETARRVRGAGFVIGNVAIQVIGNRPKLGLRRSEAEAALSGAVGAPVTLSATTTDGLGLTGRAEGLAAIATALIVPAPPRADEFAGPR